MRFLYFLASTAAATLSTVFAAAAASNAQKHTAFLDGKVYSGDATYYEYWKGNFGSCGHERAKSDPFYVAALSNKFMKDPASELNPNNRYLCQPHYCVRVTGPNGSVVVKVSDTCEGCKDDDIDLADEVFPYVADKDKGRVKVTWSFVDCNQYPPNKYDSAAFGSGAENAAPVAAAAGAGAAAGSAGSAASSPAASGSSAAAQPGSSSIVPPPLSSIDDPSVPYVDRPHKIIDKGEALVNGMLGAAAGMLGLGPAYNLAKTIAPHLIPDSVKKRVERDEDLFEGLFETGDFKKFGSGIKDEMGRVGSKVKGDLAKLKGLFGKHKAPGAAASVPLTAAGVPAVAALSASSGAGAPGKPVSSAAPSGAGAPGKPVYPAAPSASSGAGAPGKPVSSAAPASPAAPASRALPAAGAASGASALNRGGAPPKPAAKVQSDYSSEGMDSFPDSPASSASASAASPAVDGSPSSPLKPKSKIPSLASATPGAPPKDNLAKTKIQLKETYGKIKDLLLPKLQIYRDLLQKKIDKTHESLNEIKGLLSTDGQALIDRLNQNLETLRTNLNNFAVKIPVVNTPDGPMVGNVPAPSANDASTAASNAPSSQNTPNVPANAASGFNPLSTLVNSQIDGIIRELNEIKKSNVSLLGGSFGVGTNSTLNQIKAGKNASVALGDNAYAARSMQNAATKVASAVKAFSGAGKSGSDYSTLGAAA